MINIKRTHGKKNANLVHFMRPNREVGVGGGLFIGEVKGLLTLFELPLTYHYISRVHSLRGIIDYYIL
jgi:hypothetical protein